MQGNTRQAAIWNYLRNLDYLQLVTVALLLGIGLIFIHSTGMQIDTEESRGFFGRQLIWIGLGCTAYFLISLPDYRSFTSRVAMLGGYALSVILLVTVLFFGLKIFGATRWLNIFGFRLQPSEPAKLMVICALAAILSAPRFSQNKNLSLFLCTMTVLIPFILIAIEPDLGSALVLLPISCAVIFASGIKWKIVILGLAAVAVGVAVILLDCFREEPVLLRGYQRDRIKTFLDPGADLSNRGYNAHQAKIAVGAGGYTGTGIGKGVQNELGFLPRTVSNNDFIFSVIAEETGFCGVTGILFLYAMLLYSILRTAFVTSGYGRYIAVGFLTFDHSRRYCARR